MLVGSRLGLNLETPEQQTDTAVTSKTGWTAAVT